ncbi:MAG: hypothetical protein RL037_111 [Bacteroidota bacterium]|jgi:cell division protein FtsQ
MKFWLKIAGWMLLIVGVGVIFYFANVLDDNKIIKAPRVAIHYEGENAMLIEKELIDRLKQANLLFSGQRVDELNVEAIEKVLTEMPEIKSAHVYRDIGSSWNIEVVLRRPIARVFNKYGQSFYIDSEGYLMNVSASHVARTLIFTGNILDKFQRGRISEIINNDSLKSIKKLDDIYSISNYVCKDPLLYHLIAQVQVDTQGNYLMIPILGETLINFGKVESDKKVADKFERLKVFYQQGLPYEGWNRYAEINLSYDGQIVCRKRN